MDGWLTAYIFMIHHGVMYRLPTPLAGQANLYMSDERGVTSDGCGRMGVCW